MDGCIDATLRTGAPATEAPAAPTRLPVAGPPPGRVVANPVSTHPPAGERIARLRAARG